MASNEQMQLTLPARMFGAHLDEKAWFVALPPIAANDDLDDEFDDESFFLWASGGRRR